MNGFDTRNALFARQAQLLPIRTVMAWGRHRDLGRRGQGGVLYAQMPSRAIGSLGFLG